MPTKKRVQIWKAYVWMKNELATLIDNPEDHQSWTVMADKIEERMGGYGNAMHIAYALRAASVGFPNHLILEMHSPTVVWLKMSLSTPRRDGKGYLGEKKYSLTKLLIAQLPDGAQKVISRLNGCASYRVDWLADEWVIAYGRPAE